jgi:pimeloyl-ACP methyl ester carboxylesterase
MKYRLLTALSMTALLLAGCGTGTSDNYSEKEAPGALVLFSSETGNIPYPNDILFAPPPGQAPDGTLHIPYDPQSKDAPIKKQLNTLDGFSTTSPITVGVSDEVDPKTLNGRVHLYKTVATPISNTTPVPVVVNIEKELDFGKEFNATYTNGKIVLLPLVPLEGSSDYMVVLEKGILATNGKPIDRDYVTSILVEGTPLFDENNRTTLVLDTDPQKNYEKSLQLAVVQKLVQQMLTVVSSYDPNVPKEKVLTLWSFKTQTIGKVAKSFVENDYKGALLQLQDTGYTSKAVLQAAGYDVTNMTGSAQVYAGALLNIPYYLGIPSAENPTAPLTESFRFDSLGQPIPTATISIPAIAVIPNEASGCTEPSSGWPVVIYQHGITRNRTDLLALSEVFTNQDNKGRCFAAVAIDLPLHGVTDPDNLFYVENNETLHLSERTFNVDYVTEDDEGNIIAIQPDDINDSSGIHYINLRSLLTSRDNIRQSTSDFVALVNALATAKGVKLDAGRVYYVGHSLGAMVPFGFLTNHAPLTSVVLANYGGGIAQLLNHSETFGPIIQKGLANEGIRLDTPEYDAFMVATQTILDDADPVNYAASLPASGNKLLSFEVLGDKVIPNAVATAPLSGTDPILQLVKAINVDTSTAPGLIPVGNSTKTVFTEGDHSSFLRPIPSEAATYEMWGEMRSFITTGGRAILVQNPSVITER